jgi:hypothetical protein
MRSSSRRTLMSLLCCVAALVSFGLRAQASTTWAATDVRLNDPTKTYGGEAWGVREPVIAVDPTDPDVIVAAAIDQNYSNTHDLGSWAGGIQVYRSIDGGASWTDGALLRGSEDPAWHSGDPTIVFGKDGTLWLGMLADKTGHNDGPLGTAYYSEQGGVYVYRSDDAGLTWSAPARAVVRSIDLEGKQCAAPDKEHLAVDPVTGELIIAFTMFHNDCPREYVAQNLTTLTAAEDIEIAIVRSKDRGVTWSAPQRIWHGYALGAQPAFGPDGTIYVSFTSAEPISAGAAPYALGSVVEHRPDKLQLIVASSRDNGYTWTYVRREMADPDFHPSQSPFAIGGVRVPTISVDAATGRAYIAWASMGLQGTFHISAMSSTNAGQTWSEPVEVSTLTDSFMPALYANAGVAYVTFMNTPDLGASYQVYRAESRDGGASWSTAQPLSLAPSQPGDLSDYMWIGGAGSRIAAVWTDMRDGENAPAIYARTATI